MHAPVWIEHFYFPWPRLPASVANRLIGRPMRAIQLAMRESGITDPSLVVNVGDTVLDLQAGTNAKVRGVIGVLTGEQGRAMLEREPHTHLLESVAGLPELLEREFLGQKEKARLQPGY